MCGALGVVSQVMDGSCWDMLMGRVERKRKEQ